MLKGERRLEDSQCLKTEDIRNVAARGAGVWRRRRYLSLKFTSLRNSPCPDWRGDEERCREKLKFGLVREYERSTSVEQFRTFSRELCEIAIYDDPWFDDSDHVDGPACRLAESLPLQEGIVGYGPACRSRECVLQLL